MITVHHLNNSRSQRVLWLLEELELPYEIVKYERDPKTLLAPASLRAIHPLGKSPVITDGDTTMAESGAIIEYLVDTHGRGKLVPPAGTPAYRHYRYFMHYAEGSLMPFLVMRLVFNRIRSDAPFLIRPIARAIAGTVSRQFLDPNLSTHLAFLADHLAKHAWFTGDAFTAADVQMSFPVEGAVARAGGSIPPRLTEWLAKIQARPAYRKAIERGGDYAIAG
ncbi:MAG: glutathione S-transferase [Deltaproteobacteria bacterium]|nr:MAG: glutathione S-transferase [Deltaproteobacteria bacterium]